MKSLQDLCRMAIKVGKFNKEHCFCSKYETLYFTVNHIMYVLPWRRSYLEILQDEGFKRQDINVVLFNFFVPKEEQTHWNNLIKQAFPKEG